MWWHTPVKAALERVRLPVHSQPGLYSEAREEGSLDGRMDRRKEGRKDRKKEGRKIKVFEGHSNMEAEKEEGESGGMRPWGSAMEVTAE